MGLIIVQSVQWLQGSKGLFPYKQGCVVDEGVNPVLDAEIARRPGCEYQWEPLVINDPYGISRVQVRLMRGNETYESVTANMSLWASIDWLR